jgi:hypothetical protein
VRTTLLSLVLVLAACGRSDRQDAPAAHAAPSLAAPRGPDNLVLRIPRTGGTARVYAYSRLDSVIWSARGAPAPARVLAFDEEAGTIAYVDAKGQPARVDFRQGAAFLASKAPAATVASVDGSEIFSVLADGNVERYSPGGTWRWKPPAPVRALFPQSDGTVLALVERKGSAVMWRVRPPATKVRDSVPLPLVDRTLRTQVGDRLYLAAGAVLSGLRTRTMERTPDIAVDGPVASLAATPSGDRVFVVTAKGTGIAVVDRYQERVSGQIELGQHVTDLRIDPLGRYLLARPEGADSVIVVALGTNRVVGRLASAWRADLPFVAPDGGVALASGADVVIADGETQRPIARIAGGAADFWYPFQWTGFRPRAASLDEPVQFAGPAIDSTALADSAARRDSASPPVRDSTARRPATASGFTVSFAALLAADKAHDLAGHIRVGSEAARVVTSMRDGSAVYRVVLGPYSTREEAERIGRASGQTYWVYEGGP